MSSSKHSNLLTKAIFVGALSNMAQTVLSALLRMILGRDTSLTPDMLDFRLWAGELILAIFQISVTALAFYIAWRNHIEYKNNTRPDKYNEIAKLKEELSDETITTLSTYSIGQLIQVWTAVLVGAGIFYNATSIMYRNFIQSVIELINMSSYSTVIDFVNLYNSSHGFKYMGMLIALLIGIYITGVFLQDKLLKNIAISVTIIFLLSFLLLEMNTITIFSRSIGIVWTSVIFHLIQTVGLLALAGYLAWRYKGL